MDEFFNNFDNIGTLMLDALMRVIPALICITIHELAHGFTAYKLGDPTAKEMGRLTFNPIKHIDPMGLLMMLVLRFGWAKPVPVNMHNFKYPKWYMAFTAVAGPISNLILAVIFMFIFGLLIIPLSGSEAGAVINEMIFNTIYISIALSVFNMLPLPPLDGSKFLFSVLPEKTYFKLMQYERFGMILLLVLVGAQFIFGINIFQRTIGQATEFIMNHISILFYFAIGLVN